MNKNNNILVVEDDQIDAMTIKRAFKDINLSNPLKLVNNGEEALEYLLNSNNPTPCLILLDINMPRMNGLEFLSARQQHKNLLNIPVVVLTTSNEESDKIESFQLGVAGYIIKPVDYDKFLKTIHTIKLYWSLCESPKIKL